MAEGGESSESVRYEVTFYHENNDNIPCTNSGGKVIFTVNLKPGQHLRSVTETGRHGFFIKGDKCNICSAFAKVSFVKM